MYSMLSIYSILHKHKITNDLRTFKTAISGYIHIHNHLIDKSISLEGISPSNIKFNVAID